MSKVLRDLKYGELTIKDMSVLREGLSAKTQSELPEANITDYSLQHEVSMHWGKSYEETRRDLRPFLLKIDDKRFVISWGELKDMDSAGFFRREEGNPRGYSLKWFDGPKLTLDTGLNDEAQRDMIVRIYGEGFEIFVDWYEMMRAGRFI